MDLYYFRASRNPHLEDLIAELGLVDGLPYTLNDSFTWDPVINRFLLSLVVPQSPQPKTWRTYAEQLSLFFRFLEAKGKTWKDMDNEDVNTYYRVRTHPPADSSGVRPKGISARSWNLFVAALIRFANWALEKEHIAALPFKNKKITAHHLSRTVYGRRGEATNIHAKVREKSISHIPIDTFKSELIPAVECKREGRRNSLFLKLLVSTGMRISEASERKVKDFPNPDHKRYAGRKAIPMRIIGKGDKERTVYIPKKWLYEFEHYKKWERQDAINSWTKRHPDQNTADHEHAFLTESGAHIGIRSLQKMMSEAGKEVGLDFSAHPHMLRHTYAIYQLNAMVKALLEKNGQQLSDLGPSQSYRRLFADPLRTLQRRLGHTYVTSTLIYLDYLDEAEEMEQEAASWTEEMYDGSIDDEKA